MSKLERVGLFPGTFDPVTLGHLDILVRALGLFDRMVVAVAHRHQKATLFDVEERMEMIRDGLPPKIAGRVIVVPFQGLLVEFARELRVSGIVRGLRFFSDFEYEFQMALMNQKLCPEITTIFLMPTEQYSYLNATLVKEVAKNGGVVDGLVTPLTARKLAERFAGMREVAAKVAAIGAEPGTAGRRRAADRRFGQPGGRPPRSGGAGKGRRRSR